MKLILFLLVLLVIILISYSAIKFADSGIKIILLGINLTLIGGIYTIDESSSLGGIEFLFIFAGLILSIFGVFKQSK